MGNQNTEATHPNPEQTFDRVENHTHIHMDRGRNGGGKKAGALLLGGALIAGAIAYGVDRFTDMDLFGGLGSDLVQSHTTGTVAPPKNLEFRSQNELLLGWQDADTTVHGTDRNVLGPDVWLNPAKDGSDLTQEVNGTYIVTIPPEAYHGRYDEATNTIYVSIDEIKAGNPLLRTKNFKDPVGDHSLLYDDSGFIKNLQGLGLNAIGTGFCEPEVQASIEKNIKESADDFINVGAQAVGHPPISVPPEKVIIEHMPKPPEGSTSSPSDRAKANHDEAVQKIFPGGLPENTTFDINTANCSGVLRDGPAPESNTGQVAVSPAA